MSAAAPAIRTSAPSPYNTLQLPGAPAATGRLATTGSVVIVAPKPERRGPPTHKDFLEACRNALKNAGRAAVEAEEAAGNGFHYKLGASLSFGARVASDEAKAASNHKPALFAAAIAANAALEVATRTHASDLAAKTTAAAAANAAIIALKTTADTKAAAADFYTAAIKAAFDNLRAQQKAGKAKASTHTNQAAPATHPVRTGSIIGASVTPFAPASAAAGAGNKPASASATAATASTTAATASTPTPTPTPTPAAHAATVARLVRAGSIVGASSTPFASAPAVAGVGNRKQVVGGKKMKTPEEEALERRRLELEAQAAAEDARRSAALHEWWLKEGMKKYSADSPSALGSSPAVISKKTGNSHSTAAGPADCGCVIA